MKKFLLFLCFLISFQFVNAQWEPCNNGLGGNEIWCFIIDSNNTYGGIDGGIFMTSDNGNSWIAKNNGLKSPNAYYILSLTKSENRIFAGTGEDGIYLSTDKGENWVHKSNGLPYINNGWICKVVIEAIIINGNNIFAGTSGGLYLSTDNGDNWTAYNKGFKDTIRFITSLVRIDNNIFAGTSDGIYLSTDNGDNWTPKNKGIENMVFYSLAINGNNIYAGTWYGLFLSTNNGDDWKKIGVVDTTIVEVIIVNDDFIIAGAHGLYLSKDNGNNWTAINSGLTYLGETCAIINGDYIFAGTNDHGIFRAKLSDLGITDVKEAEQKNEINIFPNPATDEFRLRFHAPTETTVQLSIFDLLGNCVLSQTQQCTEGTNEKTINCEKMPQGYYFVKINMNEHVEKVPLVIVK